MWKCPKCGKIYEVSGDPPENPGGMGSASGWSCLFCVIDPPFQTKVKFAKLWGMPSWASVWMPVYLEPYVGEKEPDFALHPL